MVLVETVEDRIALEIGAQVIARHKLEVQADALRARIAELEAATRQAADQKKDKSE